jgi:hypothetical protein
MLRNRYVQNRVAQRMQSRGEAMILRRVHKMTGPVPYINPPDVSTDITVATGVTATDGNAYLGLSASAANGRLVAGDQILAGAITWTVRRMPTDILTDADGIPIADGSGNPSFGIPTIYWPDALAADNAWPVIFVTAPGTPNPAGSIGQPVRFCFAADTTVYGKVLSLEEMTEKGWTQVNSIGASIAAMADGHLVAPPAVDDLIWINGEQRSIMAVGPVFRAGVDFLYSLQAH